MKIFNKRVKEIYNKARKNQIEWYESFKMKYAEYENRIKKKKSDKQRGIKQTSHKNSLDKEDIEVGRDFQDKRRKRKKS